MTTGLPASSLIAVTINLQPPGTQFANFTSLLILGDSDVIDVHQRIRTYATLAAVSADFGTSAGEYLAAQLYFAQAPQPTQLYIGRWAKVATKGLLLGGALTATQQLLTNFTGINNGGFHITVDGGASTNVTGINLTAVTNLNGVATAIQTALQALGGSFAAVTCVWTGSQFLIKSGTTGPTSTISATTAPVAGTDLGPLILTTAATLAYTQAGIASESAVAAVTLFDTTITTQWYGLTFGAGATNADIVDADHLAIAAYIEGAGNPHLYGVSTQEAAAIVSPDTTSIGAQLAALKYNRTFYQWSSSSPFSAASLFGRAFTVNFQATNTTITLMYKGEPGVTAEILTSTQASTLNGNNYNYFAAFNNGLNIIVNGKVASGNYIDAIQGVDALANQIQTNMFNVMTAVPKIPQTDAGMNQLATAIEAACSTFVTNGFLGPGTWTAGGFGQLQQNGFLSKGYYVYAPPIASQAVAARAARQSVPYQVAAKLAGAVHQASVLLSVNA